MASSKEKRYRIGDPDISSNGALGFVVALLIVAACMSEMARAVMQCLFWPLG